MKAKTRLSLMVASTLLAGAVPVIQAFALVHHAAAAAELAKKAAPAPSALLASR